MDIQNFVLQLALGIVGSIVAGLVIWWFREPLKSAALSLDSIRIHTLFAWSVVVIVIVSAIFLYAIGVSVTLGAAFVGIFVLFLMFMIIMHLIERS